MSNTQQAQRRWSPVACAVASLVLAATAHAQSTTVESIPIDGSNDANLAVAVDAATGRLRAATAAEIQQLEMARAQSQRKQALSATSSATAQRTHASGARGARLNDSFMHFSVVNVVDGKLVASCLHANQREAAMAHGLVGPRLDRVDHKNQLPTE